MTTNNRIKVLFSGHRIIIMVILCLFGLSVVQSRQANKKSGAKAPMNVFILFMQMSPLMICLAIILRLRS